MLRKLIFIPFFFFVGLTVLQAQTKYTIKSKKAIKAYKKAAELYNNVQSREALEKLDAALKINSKFIEAWLFKADVLNSLGCKDEEIKCYYKIIEINPNFFPNTYFNLGNAHYKRGEYDGGLNAYENFLAVPKISKRSQKIAKRRADDCRFALQAIANPVDFKPINLGDSINTSFDEYWPSITADEEILIFTALVPPNTIIKSEKLQEDFYAAFRIDTTWQKAFSLSRLLNSNNNEGAQSITADGHYMYFTACDRTDGRGRCDIYYSRKEGDNWLAPINLGSPVNSEGWEAQPSISADGSVLYFVSNRKGGKGNMDIWRTQLLETLEDGRQRWMKPENMSFNTKNNELSPFIHADNTSLYFASDGLTGMGGYDLFKVNRDSEGEWNKPENMGYPINTYGDESGLIVNARGDKAYFSSDRQKDKGLDIYTFKLPQELQPMPVSYLKGKIFDIISENPLKANLELIDLESRDTVAKLKSDSKNGNYLICLPSGKKYAFNVQAPEHLFYSEYFSLKKNADVINPQYLDIGLKPIKEGETVILRNVFFDVDSWELKPESQVELEKLVLFLQNQPNIKIEIGGHTDITGSKDHNLKLSENRAFAVYNFLLAQGVEIEQLNYKGYGDSHPIATNKTEIGKAKNRRTEFKILKSVISK